MVVIHAAIRTQMVSLAFWLGERGCRRASASMYSLVAALESNEANARYYEAQALTRKGRIEDAIECVRSVLELVPDFARGHYDLGLLFQQMDRDAEAIESIDRALGLCVNVPDWHAARGFSLLRLERYVDAEQSLRRAIRHDERLAPAWFNLGLALTRLDRFEEAIDAYRSALALEPDAAASINMAELLEACERFAEAEQAAREGLSHEPNEPTLTAIVGLALHRQGKTADALTLLRKTMARHPWDMDVGARLTEVLVDAGEHHEAIATAQGLRASVGGCAAHAILAWAHLEAGRPDLALEPIESAVAGEPGDALLGAHVNGLRGRVLAALGRHDEARHIFSALERDWPQMFVPGSDMRKYADLIPTAMDRR